ncbi:MAG: ABC transporter permease [Dehalococcoidia bacterium]
MIYAIFRKDLRDAIRDARILTALLLPIGIGLIYNFIFDDSESRPDATVAVASVDATTLPDALRAVAGDTVDLTFTQASDAGEVRRLVSDGDADIGIALPSGFDATVQAGEQPALDVLLPESPGLGADYVAASLDQALRAMAGQQLPATLQVEQIQDEDEGSANIIDDLGLRRWMVLLSMILLVGMVSIVAVPVILTEETEKRTLDALTIIASYTDVVAAKALVGLAYLAITVPVLLLATRIRPTDLGLFVAVILLFSVTMIGFGLLLGGLLRTMSQLNTWSGIVLLLVVFPAFFFTLPFPEPVTTVLTAVPSTQALRLAGNALSGTALFENGWLAFPIIATWGAAAYAILLWRLARREA